jgi:hypothetical protein
MSIYPSSWSHIVQTWSSTNGLRLFINSRNGTGSCVQGQFNTLTSYKGDMDDNSF